MKTALICFVSLAIIVEFTWAQTKPECVAHDVEYLCKPNALSVEKMEGFDKMTDKCKKKAKALDIEIEAKQKEICKGKADIKKTCDSFFDIFNEFFNKLGEECVPK